MNNNYLITWEDNWADEMDISGFIVLSKDEWKDFKKKIKSITNSFTMSVGSNEEIDYEDGEDLLNTITAKSISDAEAATINKLFGGSWGSTRFIDRIENMIEDMSELDEEEGKHEYLRSEDYYENRPVGTGGRSDKMCDHCGGTIKKGEPHDVHHFYPEFASYPTHKKCTKQFMESLRD